MSVCARFVCVSRDDNFRAAFLIANSEVQGGCNHGILGFSPVRAEISRNFSQTALHLDFLSNFRKSWYRASVRETRGRLGGRYAKNALQSARPRRAPHLVLIAINYGKLTPNLAQTSTSDVACCCAVYVKRFNDRSTDPGRPTPGLSQSCVHSVQRRAD